MRMTLKKFDSEGLVALIIMSLAIFPHDIYFCLEVLILIYFWPLLSSVLKFQFTRTLSNMTGQILSIKVPFVIRERLYKLYSYIYGVQLQDLNKELTSYESLQCFFTRQVKPRQICPLISNLVSPADSQVLQIKEIEGNDCLLIKNSKYQLGELITGNNCYLFDEQTINKIKTSKDSKIYQCILYLDPGQYHRFHSPIDVTFKQRTHINGNLMPVKRDFISYNPKLYQQNERVSLIGTSPFGYLAMILVGALNVGSIDINFDKNLQTNKKGAIYKQVDQIDYTNQVFQKTFDQDSKMYQIDQKGINVKKGDEIGKFNFGSTVVLVFEASSQVQLMVKPGDIIRYGQVIASL